MNNKIYPLAIVIPAYKDTFFAQTLESIANQTNKSFTLYVGDDASPYDLYSVVEQYKDRISIVYKRFEENVGGKNLVAQWKRCIELTQGEAWIWLFSDDDIMHPECVQLFFNEQKTGKEYHLYRFNVDIIDKESAILNTCISPKKILSSRDLYLLKQKGVMNSFVVEYVFSREVYDNLGGFQCFDLAWGSDLATWMKFANANGAKNIAGGKICWRSSGENITTRKDDALANRKLIADMKFLKWVNNFFDSAYISSFNTNICAKIINGNGASLSPSQLWDLLSFYSERFVVRTVTFLLTYLYRPYFIMNKK